MTDRPRREQQASSLSLVSVPLMPAQRTVCRAGATLSDKHRREKNIAVACWANDRRTTAAGIGGKTRWLIAPPPPPALPPTIGLAARRPTIAKEPIAQAIEAEAIAAREAHVARARAICETALRLVVEHHDELRAIVGFTAHGLVRDDDRRPRHCSGRDAIEYLLRQGDAVERVLGIVAVVDRDFGPAQGGAGVRYHREDVRADRLVGVFDGDREFDGCVVHLAPVRRPQMRVAPHVKFLRRPADVD